MLSDRSFFDAALLVLARTANPRNRFAVSRRNLARDVCGFRVREFTVGVLSSIIWKHDHADEHSNVYSHRHVLAQAPQKQSDQPLSAIEAAASSAPV